MAGKHRDYSLKRRKGLNSKQAESRSGNLNIRI